MTIKRQFQDGKCYRCFNYTFMYDEKNKRYCCEKCYGARF